MEDLNSPTLDEATPVPTIGSGGGSSTDILKLGSDSSHPFFLHSSDAPGMMLVHSPFTDFKFTKSKKFGTTARSNAALSTEEGDSQSNNSGDKAMTQDQYLNLCQLLQHVKIGSQGELVTSDNVIANCAGPFNEEATGSW
uniref:Uncharacterized protein n=1 Tax=Solanum lycopersicum TaxID=4081 RepID=A0A3Q7IIR7_SOLLC